MIRQFVPAEFYAVNLNSWLTQFKYAVKMIKTHPEVALKYLVDTDYDRWKTICSEIENIDDVVSAIEFLGDSLDMMGDSLDMMGDSLDMKKGCCSPHHRLVERAIEVAKLAALPRRKSEALSHIGELEQEISKLVRTEKIMNGFIRKLHHKIEPIRKKLRQNPPAFRQNPPASDLKSTRVNSMVKQIIVMEKSRRETAAKIRMLTRELNIWKHHMATIQPFVEQNMGL
jgi:chromosome segregation ATPase